MLKSKIRNFTKSNIAKEINTKIGLSKLYSNSITEDFILILKNLIRNNKFDIENDTLGISHKHYINRSKNTFKMLDNLKGENLYRIYPDNIFCEQNLCRGHSYKSRFYHDEEHLSLDGSKLLNLEIIDTVLSIIEQH